MFQIAALLTLQDCRSEIRHPPVRHLLVDRVQTLPQKLFKIKFHDEMCRFILNFGYVQ